MDDLAHEAAGQRSMEGRACDRLRTSQVLVLQYTKLAPKNQQPCNRLPKLEAKQSCNFLAGRLPPSRSEGIYLVDHALQTQSLQARGRGRGVMSRILPPTAQRSLDTSKPYNRHCGDYLPSNCLHINAAALHGPSDPALLGAEILHLPRTCAEQHPLAGARNRTKIRDPIFHKEFLHAIYDPDALCGQIYGTGGRRYSEKVLAVMRLRLRSRCW